MSKKCLCVTSMIKNEPEVCSQVEDFVILNLENIV